MTRRIGYLHSFLIVTLAACGGNGAQAGAGGSGGPGGMPPADVKIITLSPKPIPHTSEFVATVRSLRSTTIQPQVEGFVWRIFVRAGDHVRAGQALLQIDPEKQRASVAAFESNRAARAADVAYAKQQLDRMQKLFDAGATSRAELEQAETAYKTAQAQLAAAQSQIRENEVELQYYRVTAPTAGVVGDIPVRPGDRVTNATVITTIDQSHGLEAYINVPLERAGELRLGLPVQLLDTEGAVIATNAITFIASRADDATQNVLVKALLQQVPSSIRVMQYVRARIVWSNDPGLSVPVIAVNRVSGQYFVFVVEQARQGTVARQRPVTVGDLIGEEYVVKSGLKPGERVIVSNLQKIGDGAPVKPSA
jgi:RND family efflux transporter MFP subunit